MGPPSILGIWRSLHAIAEFPHQIEDEFVRKYRKTDCRKVKGREKYRDVGIVDDT